MASASLHSVVHLFVGIGGTNMDTTNTPGEKKLMEKADNSAPNKEELTVKKVPLWGSCRLVYTMCAFLTMLNLILMRFNLSFALVCMVRGTDTPSANSSSNVSTSSCASMPPSSTNITEQRVPQGELDWDKFLQGRVLSAFFYGYVMTQGFGGWFSDRFGGKLLYIMGNLLQSLTTLLIPVCARFHPEALFGIRVLQGLVAGLSLPSVFQLYSQWAAPSERTALIGAAYAGFPFGNIIIFPLCAFICQESDWSGIFYLTGAFGLVCSISFFFLVYDNPDSHPRISEEERLYLKAACINSNPSKMQRLVVPWRAICVSPAVNAFHIAHFCYYWGFIILAVNLPTFMKEVLHFDLTQNGLLSALPYVGMLSVRVLISTCFGRVQRWTGLPLTRLRKINHTIGSLVAAVTILLVAFLDCSQQYLAVALLTIGQGMSDLCFTGSYLMSYLDMAPRYAGLLTGISNTLGSLSGVLAPTLVGILTPHGTREEWTSVLYVTCGFYFVGAVTYLMFGSSELQPWAETGLPSIEMSKLNT